MIEARQLGAEGFRHDYGVKAAYVAGAMVKGIASVPLVCRMARAGYLSFLGTGGLDTAEIDAAIDALRAALGDDAPYGLNLLANPAHEAAEMAQVALYLRRGIRMVEASAFMQVSAPLIRFRLSGATRDAAGQVVARNRLMAKISRPELAERFLAPAAPAIVQALLREGHLTPDEAALAEELPVASDICVEADSGGHTDMGVMAVLLPAIIRLRDRSQEQYGYAMPVRIGAGGGIGTPESAAAAFLLGADFILTGSINQCSVEAATSDTAKDMLQRMGVQDTAYAPAGDMFELGAKVQVLKKGVFFPARASKLYDLWRGHAGLDEIDAPTRREIQDKYFRRSFEDVWRETAAFYAQALPAELERAERNPRIRMALIFRWYFVHSMRLALAGSREQLVDYQVHTGPALGAFNQWVQGTALEDWRRRHVDGLADHLLAGCCDYIGRRIAAFR